MWKWFAITLSIAALLQDGGQERAGVHPSLLDASQLPPLQFAVALAATGFPAGLEMPESEDTEPPGLPEASGKWDKALLTDVLRLFEQRHPEYRVARIGKAVVIRPKVDSSPILDQASPIKKRIEVTGVMAAARSVFAAFDPHLSGPVLNSYGRPGEDLSIALDGTGGRTVIDMLNQIVVQAPGRAWVVTSARVRSTVKVVSFGFVEANGSRRVQRVELGQ